MTFFLPLAIANNDLLMRVELGMGFSAQVAYSSRIDGYLLPAD